MITINVIKGGKLILILLISPRRQQTVSVMRDVNIFSFTMYRLKTFELIAFHAKQ